MHWPVECEVTRARLQSCLAEDVNRDKALSPKETHTMQTVQGQESGPEWGLSSLLQCHTDLRALRLWQSRLQVSDSKVITLLCSDVLNQDWF